MYIFTLLYNNNIYYPYIFLYNISYNKFKCRGDRYRENIVCKKNNVYR